MSTFNYLPTCGPYREARAKYLTELQQVRAEIDLRNSEIAAPVPAGGPSALEIERAKLLDDINGTATAADLIAVGEATEAAAAEVKRQAAQARAALPALLARAEMLEGLASESRRLELSALSQAALKDWPKARAEYRKAADALVDKLAELMAVQAVVGAEHRARMNDQIGQGDLTAFTVPGAVLSLPSLEAIGPDLSEYQSGGAEHVHIVNVLRDRANAFLQTCVGDFYQ